MSRERDSVRRRPAHAPHPGRRFEESTRRCDESAVPRKVLRLNQRSPNVAAISFIRSPCRCQFTSDPFQTVRAAAIRIRTAVIDLSSHSVSFAANGSEICQRPDADRRIGAFELQRKTRGLAPGARREVLPWTLCKSGPSLARVLRAAESDVVRPMIFRCEVPSRNLQPLRGITPGAPANRFVGSVRWP